MKATKTAPETSTDYLLSCELRCEVDEALEDIWSIYHVLMARADRFARADGVSEVDIERGRAAAARALLRTRKRLLSVRDGFRLRTRVEGP